MKARLAYSKSNLWSRRSQALGDGSGVAQHANVTLDFGQITTRYNSWWLVVDAYLEASWTPVDKLDGALYLQVSNGNIDILWNDITTEHQAASHILAVTRITLDRLITWLKTTHSNLFNGVLLVMSLLSWDDGGIGNKREMNTRVRDKMGLKVQEIDIQGNIKTQRCSDWRYDLADETVEVGISGTVNVKVPPTDVIDGFVVNHEGTISVIKGGVCIKDWIVWLDHG